MDAIKRESSSAANDAMTKVKLIQTIDPSLYRHITDAATIRLARCESMMNFDRAETVRDRL